MAFLLYNLIVLNGVRKIRKKVEIMKGVILAAGKGTRLFPLTKGIPKSLLPVYDRPMIHYALEFMKEVGIKDVIIVVSEEQENLFRRALGDGAWFGVDITYRIQTEIDGTAGALKQLEGSLENEVVLLYYGDNILLAEDVKNLAEKCIEDAHNGYASVFALEVANPTDYGVLEIDENGHIKSFEEKPDIPKSNFIAPGIYFYPKDLIFKLDDVQLSPRGEYEMTDVNNMYLAERKLKAIKLDRSTLWFDAVDVDALLDAANIVRDHRKRKGNKL